MKNRSTKMTNKIDQLIAAGCDENEVNKYKRYQKERKQGKTPCPDIRRNYHHCNAILEAYLKDLKEQEKATKFYEGSVVLDNPEIPEKVQLGYLKIQEELSAKGLNPLKGVFLMPHIRTQTPSWWAWDDGSNGRWYNNRGEVAKVCDNSQGFYHSAVSTYVRRIERNLPLYADA